MSENNEQVQEQVADEQGAELAGESLEDVAGGGVVSEVAELVERAWTGIKSGWFCDE